MEFLLTAKIVFAALMITGYALLTLLVIHTLRKYPNADSDDIPPEGQPGPCCRYGSCPAGGESFRSVDADLPADQSRED